MSDFDAIREEGERISREEGYKVLLAEIAARDKEIDKLREAIRRLADQDATLSVCEGSVIVTMDATLTDEEREAIAGVLTGRDHLVIHDVWKDEWKQNCDTLRGLLERMGNK